MFNALSARAASDAVVQMTRLEKAFLHVDSNDIVVPGDGPTHISVTMRNAGKTPAFLLEECLDCKLAAELVGLPTYLGCTSPDNPLVSAGGKTEIIKILFLSELDPVFEGAAMAVIWGRIKYSDVFGRTWIRGFGFKLRCVFIHDNADGTERKELVWQADGGDAYNYDREEKG